MKPRTKKNPFADLPEEWRDMITQSTPEAIDAEIVRITKGEVENLEAKNKDQDLIDKREAVKFANEGYAVQTKAYRLRMKFIMQTLADKGKA